MRTVQYLERGVFEYWPENPEPYKVLARRLGADMVTLESKIADLAMRLGSGSISASQAADELRKLAERMS